MLQPLKSQRGFPVGVEAQLASENLPPASSFSMSHFNSQASTRKSTTRRRGRRRAHAVEKPRIQEPTKVLAGGTGGARRPPTWPPCRFASEQIPLTTCRRRITFHNYTAITSRYNQHHSGGKKSGNEASEEAEEGELQAGASAGIGDKLGNKRTAWSLKRPN